MESQHYSDRQALSTPCGTKGSPARPSKLIGRRVTKGKFTATGEDSIIIDDWKNRKEAHRMLEVR